MRIEMLIFDVIVGLQHGLGGCNLRSGGVGVPTTALFLRQRVSGILCRCTIKNFLFVEKFGTLLG